MTDSISTFEELAEACKKLDEKVAVRMQNRHNINDIIFIMEDDEDFKQNLKIHLHGDIKVNKCSVETYVKLCGEESTHWFAFSHDFNKIYNVVKSILEAQDAN